MRASEPVATNLITGFLGAGKTTAIRWLLARRPPRERWAILLNEFGTVGLDGAVVEADDEVVIQELPGGCLCCTLGAPLRVTLTRLLRRRGLDRLLIEPTGVGHPARVLDTLRGDGLREAIDLRATLCLVDPQRLDDPRARTHPVFRDQAELADVLVANRTDLASAGAVARFRDWAARLYPPKLLVEAVTRGRINPAWLDLQADPRRQALFPEAHAHGVVEPPAEELASPRPGAPVRVPGSGFGRHACGWLFHPRDTFDRSELLQVLARMVRVERLKGVFHCGRDWMLLERVGERLTRDAVGWRRDSRLEVILEAGADPDWERVHHELLRCIVNSRVRKSD